MYQYYLFHSIFTSDFDPKIIVTLLQLWINSEVCSDPKRCASGVEITENLRKNFAKEFQNIRNFGMLLVRALGQRALRKSRNVAAALGEVENAFGSE